MKTDRGRVFAVIVGLALVGCVTARPRDPVPRDARTLTTWEASPTIDGKCDDTVYATSETVLLDRGLPSRTSLHLAASDTRFVVCVPSMAVQARRIRLSFGPDPEARLIGPRHHALVADAAGELLLQRGDTAGRLVDIPLAGVQAATSLRDLRAWRAELAVDLSYLGGSGRRSAFHVALESDDGLVLGSWPEGSRGSDPSTWALLEIGSALALGARDSGALSLEGREGYVVIPHAPELSPAAYTIEAWVRPAHDACGTLIAGSSVESIRLDLCGTVRLRQGSGGELLEGSQELDSSWHHVAVAVEEDGDGTLYVDGEVDLSFPAGAAGKPGSRQPGSLFVGAAPFASEAEVGFRGLVRDLRVWEYARSPEELRRDALVALSGGEEGLVAAWSFKEHLRDVVGKHHAGHVGRAEMVADVSLVDGLSFCYGTNHRVPAELDRSRANPLINIATCLDERPKISIARFRDLPVELRSMFTGMGDDDRFLVYVPAPLADGRRVVTLAGSVGCQTDACPAEVTCGRATEEKCPPPPPGGCSVRLEVSPEEHISLSETTIKATLSQGTSAISLSGVIVAAGEIVLSGHVRSNGQNLALVARKIRTAGGAVVDASSLRQGDGKSRAGGQIALVAEEVSGGLTLRSFGSPGALPRTTRDGLGIHWDCLETAPDLHGNPKCFPCFLPAGTCLADVLAADSQNLHPKRKLRIKVQNGTCWTHEVSTGGTVTRYFDHPKSPARFPENVLFEAPGGHPGGAAGQVNLRLLRTDQNILIVTGPGNGSQGLQGYRVQTADRWHCPAGHEGCYLDQFDGPSYLVREGPSMAKAQASLAFRKTTDPSDFELFEVGRILADLADELVIPDQYLTSLERSYRSGLGSGLELGYQITLAALGETWQYPCSLAGRVDAARKEATARLEQTKAGLDWAGYAPAWAPSAGPEQFEALVKSELQHAADIASTLRDNVLISITSANLKGDLVKELESAEGEVAQIEAVRNGLLLKEKLTRVEELQTYVSRNQADLKQLQAQLIAYFQAQAAPPEGLTGALTKMVEVVVDFGGAYVDFVKSGYAFGKGSALAKTAKALYESLDQVAAQLSTEEFDCSADAKCLHLLHQLEQARLELYGARLALEGGLYAVQAEKASAALFDARRSLSQSIARIYQGNQFVVRDFDALSRAGKYLCQYGRMITDNAAADLHLFKRSAVLWDVPTPIAEQWAYDGGGGRYDFDFLQFLGAGCKAAQCTLWGDYNQFLKTRTEQGVPNPRTVYLGALSGDQGKALAALLHAPAKAGRVEVAFGLFDTDGGGAQSGTFFGARPPLLASSQSASNPGMVLATPAFANCTAVQLHDLVVRARLGNGQPVRLDFPFRVSRPSSENYVNRLSPRSEIASIVAVAPGRELDGGELLDRLAWDHAAGGFRLEVCCGGNKWARPESPRKKWILWVPVCPAGAPPSQECAGKEELLAIEWVQLEAKVRFRSN